MQFKQLQKDGIVRKRKLRKKTENQQSKNIKIKEEIINSQFLHFKKKFHSTKNITYHEVKFKTSQMILVRIFKSTKEKLFCVTNILMQNCLTFFLSLSYIYIFQ